MTPAKMKTIVGIYDNPVRVNACSPEWTIDRINGYINFEIGDAWGLIKIIRARYRDDPCRPDIFIRCKGTQLPRRVDVVCIYNRLLKKLSDDKKITFRKE